MRTLLCMVVLACVGAVLAKKTDEKVKVAVYYESLCPDSKKFITTQLAPVWRDLRGAIKVKLVPYGKATHNKVDGNWSFTCHHGVEECNGNKIQACILKDRQLQDTDKVDMIVCLMNQPNPDKALETCLNQHKKSDKLNKLKRCAEGSQGDTLLASYGDKTDALMKPLSFVPTVVINENFDQTLQDDSIANLKEVVCRTAPKRPDACN